MFVLCFYLLISLVQLAGDLMLVDVSLRQPGRDGKCGVIDFIIVTPAAESYCAEAARTTAICCKPQRRVKTAQILSSRQAVRRHTLWAVCCREWRRTRGKGPGNVQEDLQSYHPSNGTKWIVLVPGSDKTGTHSNGTSTTYLRSVSTKSYETACWRSYASCGCVTSSAGKGWQMRSNRL